MSVTSMRVLFVGCLGCATALGCGSESGSGAEPGAGGSSGSGGSAGNLSSGGGAGASSGGSLSGGGSAGSGSGGSGGSSGNAGCEPFDLMPGQVGPAGIQRIHETGPLAYGNQGLGFAGDFFYFRAEVSLGDARLYRASLTSGEVEELGPSETTRLLLHGNTLIWFEAGIPDLSVGELQSAPLDGLASPMLIATTRAMGSLVADESHIYLDAIEPDEIWKVARSGGAPELVASTRSEGLAVDGSHLYWLDSTTGSLRRVATGGGSPEDLVATTARGRLLLDGADVYFSDTHSIHKWSPGSNNAVELVNDTTKSPNAIALAEENVFWTHGTLCGGLSRVSTAGGSSELVVQGFVIGNWIGISGSHAYVVDTNGVYRLDI